MNLKMIIANGRKSKSFREEIAEIANGTMTKKFVRDVSDTQVVQINLKNQM
jgi:hypothetical protein